VVEFVVPPQWWEHRWLQAMAVGVVLLLVWLLYRLRLRHLMHREQELAALVDERTRQIERQKSQLRDQSQEFERQAREDALTGIPNRRAFDEHLSRECARATRSGDPLSVIVADIDRFKAINDRWTHAIGDEVLRRIAAVLHQQCRPVDTVARWGGEEFALLLPSTPRDEALRVAERLRQTIEGLDFSDIDADLHVTMSFGLDTGVAVTAGDQDALMRRADEALYRAKANGRNRVEG
jgi:diguanylate cyclase (GGDEF)-like protein